jgi:hypothetical protein
MPTSRNLSKSIKCRQNVTSCLANWRGCFRWMNFFQDGHANAESVRSRGLSPDDVSALRPPIEHLADPVLVGFALCFHAVPYRRNGHPSWRWLNAWNDDLESVSDQKFLMRLNREVCVDERFNLVTRGLNYALTDDEVVDRLLGVFGNNGGD